MLSGSFLLKKKHYNKNVQKLEVNLEGIQNKSSLKEEAKLQFNGKL